MKFVADFETFLADEVNLNQTRLDRLQESVDAIEDFLSGHETFKDGFQELIPAGSWAHRTIIRPVGVNSAFDADVLLPVSLRSGWQAKDYIEQLYAAFRSHGTYKTLAMRKTRCVRIDYTGEVHIDVVPLIEWQSEYYITNRCEPEETGRYEPSNPAAFTAWVEEQEQWTHGHFIEAVRLVKYLRDFKGTFSCKSIIIKTLLGNQVSELEEAANPGAYADVPSTLVTLMERLAAALPEEMPAVLDPAGTGDNFSERYKDEWDYKNFRTRIRDYASRMRAAYDEKDRAESTAKWQGIFGEAFRPGTVRKAIPIPYPANLAWEKEQHIDASPFNYPVLLDSRYSARVLGRVTGLATNNGIRHRGFGPYNLPTRGNRVKKGLSLKFTVTTNVPRPHSVYWKVRNGGAEAARANALRGEITPDQNNNEKTETTLYMGRHYVECYVVKDGVVVAKSRQPVIVI